jgi:hypothetical protein
MLKDWNARRIIMGKRAILSPSKSAEHYFDSAAVVQTDVIARYSRSRRTDSKSASLPP